MPPLGPLRFQPVLRRYVWGGRRLETLLGKSLGEGDNYAESWEVVDHGADQSMVTHGPWQGYTLHELVTQHGPDLFGRHGCLPQFPLLFKFLDAHQRLSVQVHPNDAQAARRQPPDLGKTEAWIVLHADSGSSIFAGLKEGVDRGRLEHALREGTAESCLHRFEPRIGDCIYLPAGTVHALGEGLVVAEIQQASNTTYRLFDWNRVGPDGRPRELHIQEGLDVTDFQAGPVHPQTPSSTNLPGRTRLIACEKFVVDRWEGNAAASLGGDQRFHILAVIAGSLFLEGDPAGRPLHRGETVLLPAALGAVPIRADQARVLDMYLP